MKYTLDELLMKMGAPEVQEKGVVSWHYFDKEGDGAGGFAEVRLADSGKFLIAEMTYLRQSDPEESVIKWQHVCHENFYLCAEKVGARYRVVKISFDGAAYPHPTKAIIELGLSIFYARALDISILMMEQSFNKQDMLCPAVAERSPAALKPFQITEPPNKEAWGIVIPFRPRIANRY